VASPLRTDGGAGLLLPDDLQVSELPSQVPRIFEALPVDGVELGPVDQWVAPSSTAFMMAVNPSQMSR
jgi:hypothetical protein